MRLLHVLSLWLGLWAICMSAPLHAQDTPDLTSLPVLDAPGDLPAAALPDQGFWLQVAVPGLYRIALDGPGMLGLTGFATATGRSDGSDPQERLSEAGSATQAGALEGLLLLPGHAYLMQIAATAPRGVHLQLMQSLDPALALTGAAIPGTMPEAPMRIAAGQDYLLRPDGPADLTVTGPSDGPMVLQIFTSPGADVDASFEGANAGAGGLFPLPPFETARMYIDARAGLDGLLPLILIRVRLLPDPTRYDEVEPGDTLLGLLPPEGREFRGALLAGPDRDVYAMVLDQAGVFDLTLRLAENGPAYLTLQRDDIRILTADLAAGQLYRPGLALPPGAYRLEISGDRTVPVDYVIGLHAAAQNTEGEPDDQPDLARLLEPGQALRGTLGPDNPGHIRFAVAMPGQLWELRGVQGLQDLYLSDGNGAQIGGWEARSGALALRLALPPGSYTAQLRGDGPYALRLTDLGPVPDGMETEPNDSETSALRLTPGLQVTGDFQAQGDRDYYEINLPAATPLTLTVTGPDDGAAVAGLFLSDAAPLWAELPQGLGPVSYSAVFAAGRHLIEWRSREDGLSGRYTMRLDRTSLAEPAEPNGVAAMPGDGVITGTIGGFDIADRVFVPLPVNGGPVNGGLIGSGAMALACTGTLRDWDLMTYGDETRLTQGAAAEAVVLPYSAALGGAVELRITADEGIAPGRYDCRVRFAPALAPLSTIIHDEAADQDTPSRLQAGIRIVGVFATENDTDRLTIGVVAGTFAGLRCDTDVTQMRADGALRRALDGPEWPDGTHPFVAGDDPITLELQPLAGGNIPAQWACDLIADAGFATPAMMGPAAPLTGYRDPQAEPAAFDPAATLSLLSNGRPDWLSPTQITPDLALDMQIAGLETPFRAYSRLGQSADLTLTATNPGTAALDITIELTALADGWRLEPATGHLTLPPGGTASLAVALEMPPMQSPVTDPQLMVTAHAGAKIAAVTVPVLLDPAGPDRGGHRFWSAPDSLRGGLNPLLWQHGARLIALDGETLDDAAATDWAFLHDGQAPHTGVYRWFRARQAVFRLAEPAPIAGLVVHLRSTEARSQWPAGLRLELSADGQIWDPALTVSLTASDLPQVFALPVQMQAGFARITVAGCRADPGCNDLALPEVGLVADPGWRLSDPVDLADPALGGHVVAGLALGGIDTDEGPFGGPWNRDLLTADSASETSPVRDDLGDRILAIIGFHAARAARISAIEWVGHPGDIARLAGAGVEVSLTGPAGPWQPIGQLAAPRRDTLSARLDLSTPVWARALRLTFRRDATDHRALPDRIRVWEDPTAPPLWGLWEDDRPDAGYEATEAPAPAFAPPPSGGPDRDHPAALVLGQIAASSVQLDRNADWWAIDLPQGPLQTLSLRFAAAARPEFTARLTGPDGTEISLTRAVTPQGDLILSAPAAPGRYLLAIEEPPRSVAILWDTSGSVQAFVPGILAAVRVWSQSLQPGRDRLQLLAFGQEDLLLDDWAGTPAEVYPALGALPRDDSSDSETAMGIAASALAAQDGQRGIVVITDAETSQSRQVWGPLLQAAPRVVALSIDSGDMTASGLMQDWASLNGGYFSRVTGNAGLADGLDLAAALFREPKGYSLTATTADLREPEGQGRLVLHTAPAAPDAQPTGGIEVILDASGSMLQRLPDGQRRIAVAHEALAGLVRDTLPEGTPFAFRAFGLDPGACRSELIVPMGPLDRAAAEAAIRAVPAVNEAKTAIAASLALAGADLAALDPPRVVVLVTDGAETCDGDVGAEIRRLRDAGLDLRLTIVGFAIDDAVLAATFAAWAQEGGGQYLTAGDSDALSTSISEAIAPRFALDRLFVDGRTAEVAVVGLETEITLPAGQYRLRPLQTALGAAVTLTLTDGALSELTYDPALGLMQE